MQTARDTQFSGNFQEVISYYSELRSFTYEEARQNYLPQGFSIGPIGYQNAIEADQWPGTDKLDRTAWKWIDAFHVYRAKSSFKRFDICIKKSGKTVGLSYGLPTAHKTKLKIDIVEATPFKEDKLNIKVFDVISDCAQTYALLLGADEVRIMNPLNDKLAKYYCSYGYQYVEPAKKSLPIYCSMKL